jgi:hypothetical protein
VTAVRVYVATTEGPAEIQRLTEESPLVRSVVCLDGKAVALPISADYDSFVRRPTGVVERLYGHPAYRLDVSARITDGLSWQLGALLAHALAAKGRLASVTAPAGEVVWATGEVDAALVVRPVDAVPRKLHSSAELLRSLAAMRTEVLVMVAREDEDAARAALSELQLLPACRLVAVATAAEAFAALDLAPPPSRAGAASLSTPRRRSRRLWKLAGVLVAVLGALAALVGASWREPVAAWTRLEAAGELPQLAQALAATEATPRCLTCATMAALFRERLAAARPARSAIRLEAAEVRGAPFGGCGELTQAPAGPKTLAVERTADGGFAPSAAAGLCAVRYSVSGAPFVALMLAAGRAAFGQPTLAMDIGPGRAQVQALVPRWMSSPVENRLLVLAAAVPLEPLLASLSRQGRLADLPAAAALERLAGPSVLAFELRHTIAP